MDVVACLLPEAAGTPPTKAQVEQAARCETARASAAEHKQEPAGVSSTSGKSFAVLAVLLRVLSLIGLGVALS
ncbi:MULTISPECIES: hypothetical protein [Actibacterium]|uniref:Uncharacterized protein n=1 Tax=Actibacterium naphthalenivorans TaxID=1614693 RepID=A0A840CCC0_9RHOB|nr:MULTISPECIES: hypothetical protein [Actibacterium]ALG89217.1 hypothetical protein TQ29_02305 [Actibacterium sp. EMB200-NS6]MBB4021198.1 hypothetical protein [Actibacterium naphthalenivorans]